VTELITFKGKVLIMAILIWILFIVGCAIMAKQKNRDVSNWTILGLLFGIFAFIAILVIDPLPTPPTPPTA
jgi:hypothetical protein